MTLVAWNNGDGTIDHFSRLRSASYERLMTKLPQRTRALMNRFMAAGMKTIMSMGITAVSGTVTTTKVRGN